MSRRSDGPPVIGLTTYESPARWGVWDQRAVLLPTDYVRAVALAGAVPVLLPPFPGVIPGALPRLDALVLTGGLDIAPHRYGEEPHPRTDDEQPERDDAELALLEGAVRQGLPVLGICRGLQLVNVARGGTLAQHLPEVVGGTDHSPGGDTFGDTDVEVTPGSRLAEALGRTRLTGRCHHHQAIGRLGGGLQAVARAADGTVEAVEDPELPFFLAVQWHPEIGDERRLFEALVQAAGR